MTLNASLHYTSRTELSQYMNGAGASALRFISTGLHADQYHSVDIWLPRPVAEEIHAVMEKHRKANEEAEQ